MSQELLPCPFCGGNAYTEVLLSGPYVSCRNCGGETRCYPTEDQAIAAWNARLSATPPLPFVTAEGVDPDKLFDYVSERFPKIIERLRGPLPEDGELVREARAALALDWTHNRIANLRDLIDRLASRFEGLGTGGGSMKMLVDQDWLAQKVATDPDMDCEAGARLEGLGVGSASPSAKGGAS